MGYISIQINKAKGSADTGASDHIERKTIPKNADPTRTHLNRELVEFPDGVSDRTEAISHRIRTAGIKRKITPDQVRAIRIVLSGTHEDMMKIQDEGRLDEWCDDNLQWLHRTFGKENTVSAVLHMDEHTPHIHATVVPIVTGERRKAKKKQTEGKRSYRKKANIVRLCAQKEERKFKSWFLYVHSLIIGVVSWVVVPVYEFRFYALAIAFSHLVIDVIKTYSPKGLWNFVIDQVAHLAILIIVIFSFDTTTKLPIQSMDCNGSYSIPLFILALLLCIKPANILIKLVLKKYQVGETQSCENIKNAGALIGNLERILTIIFVIIGQYEAIGFIIAAKSILRFKDTDTAKTEYVLAGTFLSFGIALLCGLMATK